MRKKQWFLVFNHVRIDVTINIDRGKIVGFSVNLSIEEEGEKKDIARWDTAHGYLHKYEFWGTTKTIKDKKYENVSLDVAFREIYKDMIGDWRKFVERWKNARKSN